MNQVRCLRSFQKQFTYPYRYVKLSRHIIIKNPHKMHITIKKATLHCAPSIVSEVMSEALLSPIKSSTSEIIEHYIVGMCLHTIVATLLVSIFYNVNETTESN